MKKWMQNYRLRHIRLGRTHYKGNPFRDWDGKEDFTIRGMSRDLRWQTDLLLAVMIRDYIRDFSQKTPVIGNRVLMDNPEGIPYEEFLLNRYKGGIDFFARWQELLAQTADEFDALVQMLQGRLTLTAEERQAKIEKAFSDLAYIYADLCW